MTIDEVNAYDLGYKEALTNAAGARDALINRRTTSPPYFIRGIEDGLAGKPKLTYKSPPALPAAGGGVFIPPPNSGGAPGKPVAGGPPPRPAPKYDPEVPGQAAQDAESNRRYFEVVAQTPLGPIPYDFAVSLENQGDQGLLLRFAARLLLRFDVIGPDAADSRRGYGLSGPNGEIARQVRQFQAERKIGLPRNYGLDGWYAAKTSRGLRFIGRAELRALGIARVEGPLSSLKEGLPAFERDPGGTL